VASLATGFVLGIGKLFAEVYATEPPPEHKLEGSAFATTAKGEITYTRTDVIASAIVLTCVLSLYLYFSGLFF